MREPYAIIYGKSNEALCLDGAMPYKLRMQISTLRTYTNCGIKYGALGTLSSGERYGACGLIVGTLHNVGNCFNSHMQQIHLFLNILLLFLHLFSIHASD